MVDVKGVATVGLNESCCSDDKSKYISSLQPPMTRGMRHQLDYHTPRIESRKATGNRVGVARSQRRRLERVRETEAAVVQSEAHNAALRSQLAAAVRFIEHRLQRRVERVRETEAVQSEAHNAALRAQLAAAVRFIGIGGTF